MSRNLSGSQVYSTTGANIPVRWSPPEVRTEYKNIATLMHILLIYKFILFIFLILATHFPAKSRILCAGSPGEEVHQEIWCVELWDGHVWDMVLRLSSISTHFRPEKCKLLMRYPAMCDSFTNAHACKYLLALYYEVLLYNSLQVVKLVVGGRRHIQSPPTQCPRAVYDIMVQCW